MRRVILTALSFIGFAFPAFAQDATPSLPPAGQTFLDLSVTEHAKMPQDTLSTDLRYELDGGVANEIQDRINKAVAGALAEAGKFAKVKASTDNYYVYAYDQSEVTDPRTGQPLSSSKKWRGAQTVHLESTDSRQLLELAGKIQTMGFVMNGLSYYLSQEKADSAANDLMARALKTLGQKAKLAATALGKNNYDIVSVSVDGATPPPQYDMAPRAMPMSKMAGAEGVAPPSAQAAEADVSMTVTARVLLKP